MHMHCLQSVLLKFVIYTSQVFSLQAQTFETWMMLHGPLLVSIVYVSINKLPFHGR